MTQPNRLTHSAMGSVLLATLFSARCDGVPLKSSAPGATPALSTAAVETTRDGTSTANSINDYKLAAANRIVEVNSTKVFIGKPQALLRSVIVIKYAIDANGNLVRSDIMRSNKDRENEATATSSLKKTAPFPKPAVQLLKHGKVEILETWLFNNDGRFQLRTVAEPQSSD